MIFNPPPGWPKPPHGWTPPNGWTPDPSWPKPPEGWELWIPADDNAGTASTDERSDGRKVATLPVAAVPPEPSATLNIDQRISLLEAENAALRARLDRLGSDAAEIVPLNDEQVLQQVGIYRYHHPLENAVAYRHRLDELAVRIVDVIKSEVAIEKSNMFTFSRRNAETH